MRLRASRRLGAPALALLLSACATNSRIFPLIDHGGALPGGGADLDEDCRRIEIFESRHGSHVDDASTQGCDWLEWLGPDDGSHPGTYPDICLGFRTPQGTSEFGVNCESDPDNSSCCHGNSSTSENIRCYNQKKARQEMCKFLNVPEEDYTLQLNRRFIECLADSPLRRHVIWVTSENLIHSIIERHLEDKNNPIRVVVHEMCHWKALGMTVRFRK